MKKRIQKKLPIHRETLLQLGQADLKPAGAARTLPMRARAATPSARA
jgi:hypothetical protein